MAEMQNDSAIPRWGIGLLLAAALLVAGILAWRTLSDSDAASPPVAQADAPPSIEQLRAIAEADPGNPLVWQDLGFAYFESGDFSEAAAAYQRATEADPQSAIAWSAFGEAQVMASTRDPMPAPALEAFRKAIAADPTDPRARYFLAVNKDLGGDHEGAIADWLALLTDTPVGAPWEGDLKRTIEQVGKINDIATEARIAAAIDARSPMMSGPELTGGAAIPGPSQEQIAAAGAMSPSDQRNMAVGMVERLEARLESDPSNVDGWVMLMRSRMTLDEPGKARQALAAAIAANPAARERLQQEAAQLGVR